MWSCPQALPYFPLLNVHEPERRYVEAFETANAICKAKTLVDFEQRIKNSYSQFFGVKYVRVVFYDSENPSFLVSQRLDPGAERPRNDDPSSDFQTREHSGFIFISVSCTVLRRLCGYGKATATAVSHVNGRSVACTRRFLSWGALRGEADVSKTALNGV